MDSIFNIDFLKGHSDSIILSLLLIEDNYGYALNELINEISDGGFVLTEATMYTAFKRLETNGYVVSYWTEGINKKRKYYSITSLGIKYLDAIKVDWDKSKGIIDKFLKENK